jgi:hypothetical protein
VIFTHSCHLTFFLFLQISVLLWEDDKQLLKFIHMRCKTEDLIHAYLVSHFYYCCILRHSLKFICKSFFIAKQFFQQIFIPVLNNAHWTMYCINKVHKQIEILDHQNWEQKDDKNRYHAAISVQI